MWCCSRKARSSHSPSNCSRVSHPSPTRRSRTCQRLSPSATVKLYSFTRPASSISRMWAGLCVAAAVLAGADGGLAGHPGVDVQPIRMPQHPRNRHLAQHRPQRRTGRHPEGRRRTTSCGCQAPRVPRPLATLTPLGKEQGCLQSLAASAF